MFKNNQIQSQPLHPRTNYGFWVGISGQRRLSLKGQVGKHLLSDTGFSSLLFITGNHISWFLRNKANFFQDLIPYSVESRSTAFSEYQYKVSPFKKLTWEENELSLDMDVRGTQVNLQTLRKCTWRKMRQTGIRGHWITDMSMICWDWLEDVSLQQ